MGHLTGFGIGLALSLFTIPSVWAACTFNEAEGLNGKITSKIIIAKSLDGWTAQMDERLEEIKNQFNRVGDQHSVAETTDEQTALDAVCDDYRVILVEIDELTKPLE